MPKPISIKLVDPTFSDVKSWYETNMALGSSNINLNDQSVYEYVYHDGRFPGIFQATSSGAQRLFKKAKPTSVDDIAMLTSIYRPGPLAANVDKLYLKAKNDGDQYDWGDKRINELLKDTYGLLIFQEGVMMLAEKVAGFPKDKCDEVRRAIMKRSISGGDAAKAKVDEMQSEFVAGAVKNGYDEKVASQLYEKIAYFSGYAFNKSHATAYAIDSYWCAWLLKHHEVEWLLAYLEIMSGTPDNKAEAFGYVRSMGYKIVDIDINHATASWTALPGKKLMPSFLSCKGIGESAVEEIMQNRPYKSIEEMLWNDDGTWRHSKFNRRALEALIQIGAFDSMDIIGEGKLFDNYNHMHQTMMGEHVETVTRKRKGVEETVEVVKDHHALIKRSTKSDPHEGRKLFFEIARTLRGTVPDWTAEERAKIYEEVFGTLDATKLMDKEKLARLDARGVKPIDAYEEPDIYWFTVSECLMKKTKNGKTYAMLKAMGPSGKEHKLNVWGAKMPYAKYSSYVAEISANDFGKSTVSFKVKGPL